MEGIATPGPARAWPFLLLLLAAGAAALSPQPAARAQRAGPPNVVFIMADDLGWTDLGCYGSGYYETPNIDRLARQGMRFTHAYANGPNCAPTRASLMTGQYTPRHGITQVGAAPRGRAADRKLVEIPSRTALPPAAVTLAEALKRAPGGGCATASIGKWHLGGGAGAPHNQGFDLNVAGDGAGGPPGYFAPYRKELRGIGRGREGEYLTDRLTEEAVRFMEANRARPFFLYLTHFAVHTPIQGKKELVAKYAAKAKTANHDRPEYAAMVESLDASVGQVLAALDRLGLAEETLVVFTSDNGGWSGATTNRPLRGYKGMLYEGGIRVPLIARWPGKVRAGSECDAPVISLDWYPTLLHVAGLEPRPGQVLDGENLVPLLQGAGPLRRAALYWHFPHYLEAGPRVARPWRTTPAGAVRQGDLKLIEFFEDGRLELYDLKRDPGETRNLAPDQPDQAQALHRALRDWRAAVGARVPQPVGTN